MSQIKNDRSLSEVYETILESGMETFQTSEIQDYIDFFPTNPRLRHNLNELAESDFLDRVNKCPYVYSIRSYQSEEALKELDLTERKAVDEVVTNILNEEELSERKAKKLVDPYFEDISRAYRLLKSAKILDAARDLDFIEYEIEEELYRSKK